MRCGWLVTLLYKTLLPNPTKILALSYSPKTAVSLSLAVLSSSSKVQESSICSFVQGVWVSYGRLTRSVELKVREKNLFLEIIFPTRRHPLASRRVPTANGRLGTTSWHPSPANQRSPSPPDGPEYNLSRVQPHTSPGSGWCILYGTKCTWSV